VKLLPYIGGKHYLVKQLLKYIPYHNTYVEVFGGSGIFLIKKPLSFIEVYNDKDDNLYNFMIQVRDNTQKLFYWIKRTPISVKLFKLKPKNDIEKAGLFYIKAKYIYSGKIGETPNSLAYHKRPLKISGSDFIRYAIRLRNVMIENLDYKDCIEKYDRDDTFFYCDPPYWGINYYNIKWNKEEHLKLFNTLKNIKGKFLLSYNDCKHIRNLYKDFKIDIVEARYSTGVKKYFKEILIRNYGY